MVSATNICSLEGIEGDEEWHRPQKRFFHDLLFTPLPNWELLQNQSITNSIFMYGIQKQAVNCVYTVNINAPRIFEATSENSILKCLFNLVYVYWTNILIQKREATSLAKTGLPSCNFIRNVQAFELSNFHLQAILVLAIDGPLKFLNLLSSES